ncbi:hypothetical protein C8J56DRAFT_1102888 [Mycena floridula]|nr:hypothetical protein C8J56DRAFT_1102888 [Mycena floridula]
MSTFSKLPQHEDEYPLKNLSSKQDDGTSVYYNVKEEESGLLRRSRRLKRFAARHNCLWDSARWISFSLHVFLVFLFMLLSFTPNKESSPGIRSLGLVHPISLKKSVYVSSAVTNVMSAFVNIYSMLLTTAASGLELRRMLHRRGTLTEKHDSNAAWSGLPNGILNMFQRNPYAIKASLFAVAYLAGLAAFQTITPAVLSFQTINQTYPVVIQTQGIPDFANSLGNLLTGPSSLMTMDSLKPLNLPGLSNTTGTMYDVPVNDTSKLVVDTFNVNATHFNVTCGTMSGTILSSGSNLSLALDVATNPTLPLTSLISGQSVAIYSAPWSSSQSSPEHPEAFTGWPANILVVSTVPIRDSSGKTASAIPVNPPVTYESSLNGQHTQVVISQLAVMACNLTLNYLEANITSNTHALVSFNTTTEKSASTLSPFPVEHGPVTDNLNPIDNLVFAWGFSISTPAEAPLSVRLADLCKALSPSNGNSGLCDKQILQADQFIMEALDLYPDIIFQRTSSITSIFLHDLENALSRVTATLFWIDAFGDTQKFSDQLFLAKLSPGAKDLAAKKLVIHDALVMAQRAVSQLSINMLQVYFGLATSIFLLALAMPGILNKNDVKVDSAGILQVIWLLQEHPEIQQAITRVQDPSDAELRKAGMTEVCFGEELKQAAEDHIQFPTVSHSM